MLLYPPGLDFIPAFFGCLYAGVIAVPAYPPQPSQASRTLPRLLSIVADADVAIVLANASVVDAATRMSIDAPALAAIPWLATDTLPEHDTGEWREVAIDTHDLAFLQYTSGSTASPRGVMVSHANLLHNLAYASHAANRDRSTRSVSWLPVIHDMGLIEGVLGPIFGGYPAFLMAPASFLHRPIRWLRAITRYRASTSGGPNFAYDLCVRKVTEAQRDALDLSSWRTAYNGAEPIRAETLEAFHARFNRRRFPMAVVLSRVRARRVDAPRLHRRAPLRAGDSRRLHRCPRRAGGSASRARRTRARVRSCRAVRCRLAREC